MQSSAYGLKVRYNNILHVSFLITKVHQVQLCRHKSQQMSHNSLRYDLF